MARGKKTRGTPPAATSPFVAPVEVKSAPYVSSVRLPADMVVYGEKWGGPWKTLVCTRFTHPTNGETWDECKWVPA